MTSEVLASYRLNWLKQSFYARRSASKAVRQYLRLRNHKYGRARMRHLLRHHGESVQEITDSETIERDNFDFLLAYYSLRELAAAINYVPMLRDSSLELAEEILEYPPVLTYREEHYPLLLPSFALARIKGMWAGQERTSAPTTDSGADRIVGVFEEFVQMLQRRYADREIDTFLWFLDDGLRDGESLADTLKALGDPEKIAYACTTSYRRRTYTEDSVVGFVRFIQYSRQLLWLIDQLPEGSLIQSGLWHFHAYWFTEMTYDFRSVLAKALRRIEPWAGARDGRPEKGIDNHIVADIGRLFDPALGQTYLAAARGVLDPDLVGCINRDMRTLSKFRQ